MPVINETKTKVKDYLANIKLKVKNVATPVIYLEYCCKFTLALDKKRLTILRNTIIGVNITAIILRLFIPSLISLGALILSLCYNLILFSVIFTWKTLMNEKNKEEFKKDTSKIKLKQIDVSIKELPKELEKFND